MTEQKVSKSKKTVTKDVAVPENSCLFFGDKRSEEAPVDMWNIVQNAYSITINHVTPQNRGGNVTFVYNVTGEPEKIEKFEQVSGMTGYV